MSNIDLIGKAGEHLVCTNLLKQGYQAYIIDDRLPYDVVVEINNNLKKIQVKTASQTRKRENRADVYDFRLTRSDNKPYEDIDYIACVALDINFVAYLSWEPNLTNISFLPPGATPNKRTRIKSIYDYPFEV